MTKLYMPRSISIACWWRVSLFRRSSYFSEPSTSVADHSSTLWRSRCCSTSSSHIRPRLSRGTPGRMPNINLLTHLYSASNSQIWPRLSRGTPGCMSNINLLTHLYSASNRQIWPRLSRGTPGCMSNINLLTHLYNEHVQQTIPGFTHLQVNEHSALPAPTTCQLSTIGSRAFPVAASQIWNSAAFPSST